MQQHVLSAGHCVVSSQSTGAGLGGGVGSGGVGGGSGGLGPFLMGKDACIATPHWPSSPTLRLRRM